ncbi:hypothetical protein HKCCE4037_05635 [Rhodobacterales bacterium HKCCE4037]|nr:hypothetical protein [Rhodobacterales bacterium HKCCE4037]
MKESERMTKQPSPPNAFANQGRPAFVDGGTPAKKIWAIVTIVGFGVFWVALLFSLAEFFGARDLTIWAEVLTVAGLAVGILGRVMTVREVKEAR